jgi:hypothetical protein
MPNLLLSLTQHVPASEGTVHSGPMKMLSDAMSSLLPARLFALIISLICVTQVAGQKLGPSEAAVLPICPPMLFFTHGIRQRSPVHSFRLALRCQWCLAFVGSAWLNV